LNLIAASESSRKAIESKGLSACSWKKRKCRSFLLNEERAAGFLDEKKRERQQRLIQ
jgi:hypothetical protein